MRLPALPSVGLRGRQLVCQGDVVPLPILPSRPDACAPGGSGGERLPPISSLSHSALQPTLVSGRLVGLRVWPSRGLRRGCSTVFSRSTAHPLMIGSPARAVAARG